MGKQSLSDLAPDIATQFKHNLSLASSSKSDKQKRDALSYLTNQLSAEPPINPVGTNNILTKLLPLISDNSTPARKQLLTLLQTLPGEEVGRHADQAVLYVRAGMTHLSADISNDSLGVMEWLLDVAADELVSCAGGWVKTLDTFCAMMGWAPKISKSGWSSGARVTLRAKDAATQARQISALAKMLQAGLAPTDSDESDDDSDAWDSLYRIPRDPKSFDYLNLNSGSRNDEEQMYASREERQQVFKARFFDSISQGADEAIKVGGLTGRAAAALRKALNEGMVDFEEASAIDSKALLDLW
jgi:pre-rRNA-processing protein IPI1